MPVAPYRVPAHGGDLSKLWATRAVKRKAVHAAARLEHWRRKKKRFWRKRTCALIWQERLEARDANHIHPRHKRPEDGLSPGGEL